MFNLVYDAASLSLRDLLFLTLFVVICFIVSVPSALEVAVALLLTGSARTNSNHM